MDGPTPSASVSSTASTEWDPLQVAARQVGGKMGLEPTNEFCVFFTVLDGWLVVESRDFFGGG